MNAFFNRFTRFNGLSIVSLFTKVFLTKAFLTTVLLTTAFTAKADIPPEELGIGADEPLPPEQAFALTTSVTAADMIRAEWDIVDGYYLYRKKFQFISNTPDISVQEAVFPKGKIKKDEFFGEVETYRGKIAVDIPIVRTGSTQTLDLTIVSQGCADIGLCYPPQKQQVSLTLPPLTAAGADVAEAEPPSDSISPLTALKKLGDSLGLSSNEEEFLPGDQVFIFSAEAENGNLIKARWDILDGYYLYRDKFKFELQNAEGVTLGTITMPAGKVKVDESFGRMEVYYHEVEVPLPLNRTNLDPTELTLVAKFQGCADRGFCYPPMKSATPITLPAGLAVASPPAVSGGAMGGGPAGEEFVSEQDQLADMIKSGNFLLTLLIFFGSGLLLAFTPCVFPMIPILSSIIAGQGDSITTRKAFTMSLVYVLAMALTYTVAGVFAGVFGSNLQAAFQNPWILSTFALVFVALSFSMFGFYELQMPSSIQSKLTEISNRQQGGTLTGVAIMGFLSALIVGPCVAAPLMGALIYIGQTGDAVLGGSALFALSLGMGAPLLVIGTAAGKLLPKAGGWMDSVKAVFGVLLLAVAIWMLERIIPAQVSMLLWAALLIVSAIYMGALDSLPQGVSGWRRLWKGVGLIGLIYGALLLVGVSGGGSDSLQPLKGVGFAGGGSTQASIAQQQLHFKKIKGLDGLNRELQAAKAEGKVVMLDFYADWCVSCKEMEKYTFSDPAVQQVLQDVVLLKADVTPNDDLDQALLKNFGLVGPPSILFFDRNGEERRNFRLVGFLKPEKFKAHVEKLKS
ncbi:MAG: protein-disulfide reductase DsbD [Gammaproteobacteria bacterium]|jgi:thiol:disulfide interchange protein DsbD